MNLTKFDNDIRLSPAISLEIKAEASGFIQGYASTFGGKPDYAGDVVTKGAFLRTLAEHKANGSMPAMLWSHQKETPIGRWTFIEEDAGGLLVKGQVNLNTSKGREAFEHIKAGDVGAFSIGYAVAKGGRKYMGQGAWSLDDVDLAEISVVAVPANPRARITSVKHLETKADAVNFLREAGLSKQAATLFAAGGYPALSSTDHPTINPETAAKLAKAIEQATLKIRSME